MSNTMSPVSWETLQKGNDGKLSLQMDGKQLQLQARDDGKVEIAGTDGKVIVVLELAERVDPNDPNVIEMAKTAAEKNNLELKSVLAGAKQSVLCLGTNYNLVILAKDSNGATNLCFTVVFQAPCPCPWGVRPVIPPDVKPVIIKRPVVLLFMRL